MRLYKDSKGNEKKCSYVILPNILYDCGESWENEISFSTKFKQIRNMIDILGTDGKDTMFTKYVKTKDPNKEINENKEELGDYSDEYDEMEKIIEDYDVGKIEPKINNDVDVILDINIDDLDLPKLIDMYGIKCVDKNIANMTLKKFKQIINNTEIETIRNYTQYIKLTNYPIDNPQIFFSRDWISWGDFLIDTTFNYNEAKKFIKNNLNLVNVNSP